MKPIFSEVIAAELVKKATKFAFKRLTAFIDTRKNHQAEWHDAITEDRLIAHSNRVLNWASTYTFLGLGIPKNSERDTIALRFNLAPRRYRRRSLRDLREHVTESALLDGTRHIVVLGEPGAGKTTTLRRLALSTLAAEAGGPDDKHQFPVLLLLREIPQSKFICEELCDAFGLKFTKQINDTKNSDRPSQSLTRSDYDIKIGSIDAEEVLGQLLDTVGAVLLLDGLDEVDGFRRIPLEREIERLTSRMLASSTVLSCRSGDFSASLHNFEVVEISPLDEAEIQQVAAIWLADPQPFIAELRSSPYRDIIDRPLLLTFLLFLFNTDGRLPEQPSLIYRRVVYRLLREWDEERRISRSSRYAHFDADRKIDFLSELAYELTYQSRDKIFDEQLFNDIYTKIHSRYRLPISEHRQVAAELQTHTGVIVATGADSFEFSHLSIQEYLCANYIVREPIPELLNNYLSRYPAPVAVACALSSNPSTFLAELVHRHLTDRLRDPSDKLHGDSNTLQLTLFGNDTALTLKSFLSRIKSENPMFRVDRRLGESTLYLFAFYYRRYSTDVDAALVEFMEEENIKESVVAALSTMEPIEPVALVKSAIAIPIDNWFREIYTRIHGFWNPESGVARRLPLVILPTELFRKLSSAPLANKEVRSKLRERMRRQLSQSPFCELETGRHSFPLGEKTCRVCGWTRTKRPKRGLRTTGLPDLSES